MRACLSLLLTLLCFSCSTGQLENKRSLASRQSDGFCKKAAWDIIKAEYASLKDLYPGDFFRVVLPSGVEHQGRYIGIGDGEYIFKDLFNNRITRIKSDAFEEAELEVTFTERPGFDKSLDPRLFE